MVPVAPPTFLTQMQQMDTDEELGIVNDNGSDSDQSPEREPEIVTFSGMALAEHEEEYQRARSAMVTSELTTYSRPVSRRKKKQETPRPYTPQHTNLSANLSLRESVTESEQDMDITKDALFRQLCVLHWILEAMSTDPPSPMTPIMSCWSLTETTSDNEGHEKATTIDIGGSRAQPKKLLRDKATESGWANFLNKDTAKLSNTRLVPSFIKNPSFTGVVPDSESGTVSKRLSTQRLVGNRAGHARRALHTTTRNSSHSSVGGSQLGSNAERVQSPSNAVASKFAMLLRSKPVVENPPPSATSPVPSKLTSLLKPKLPDDPSPAPSPIPSKLSSLLKPKLVLDQDKSLEADGLSPTKRNSVDYTEPNIPSQSPTPTLKLGALFGRKTSEDLRSKSPTPPNMNPFTKSVPTEQASKASLSTKVLGNKDLGSNSQNIPKTNSPLKSPAKFKSSLGCAASLGQFIELKMRGGLNSITGHMSTLGVRNEDLSPRVEEEDDQMYNKSIFKFLDEYYESLKTEEGKKDIENKSPSSTPPTSPVPDKKVKSEGKKKKKRRKEESENKEKRLDHKVAVALGEEETMTSKYLRANAHLIRPMSSPALTEFQAGLPSSKKVTLCADLHNQFAETREEKALTLHDILDHKESQRLSVCQSKFVSLQGMRHGSSFHRAVEEMRSESWRRLRKPINNRKKSTAKGNWYTDLMEKIPHELKHEWYYAKILQKLGNFGLVEGRGKQSIYKFIKILEGLREWEICSPDITAAIEFCREHIVEMTIEEYESWFVQRFPKITRPQTAPAGMKGGEKNNDTLKTPSATTRAAITNKRPSQSAFATRKQN
ncbi:Coiled-coil domain-containing protein 60 [Mactra antiquata]